MYTLGQFLKTDLLPWYTVLSGGDGLESRPVEYISVTELLDGFEEFIRENEIILSSAMGCEEDDAQMLRLIAGVHDRKACALLLTNREDALTLPDSCREYLAQTDFPVIHIPWSCRFADLLELALDGIHKWNRAHDLLFETLRQRLLTAYLASQPFSAAAQIIAEQFHCACAIYDIDGRALGSSMRKFSAAPPDGDPCAGARPIEANERLYGYFRLENPDVVSPPAFERFILSPLILWFDREQTILAAQQAEKDDFIWALAKGSSENHDELIRRGNLLGFHLTLPYACAVGRMHTDFQSTEEYMNRWLSSNIFPIKEQILTLMERMSRHVLLTYQQNLLILFIESDLEGSDRQLNQALDSLEKKLAVVLPHLRFCWGLGATKTDPAGLHESFMQAKLAQELCPCIRTENTRFTYKKTVIFHVLTALSEHADLRRDVLSVVDPLLQYDRERQTDLLHTLQVYLRLRNVSEAARTLQLHRQSLIYRINKIEELTGMSFKDADNCFLLEIAVRLLTQ